MKSKVVGKVRNVSLDDETGDVFITIEVTDAKFRKKILRDFALAGNIKIEGEEMIYSPSEGKENASI